MRRRGRIRAKIGGTAKIPRVSVFRSNRDILVQFVDDSTGKTIISSVKEPKAKGTKTEIAAMIGEKMAQRAKESGISEIVFDRGGYKYHGRVKALAEGLRKGGLKF